MILVGDIGGTRTRLALAVHDGPGFRFDKFEESPTTAGVADVIARFLGGGKAKRPEAAAFCGAGPVRADGSIQLTNTDVKLEPAVLADAAGIGRAILVNDFQAVAQSIPVIPAESLEPCGGGKPVSGAPIAVLGPGTGLGVGILSHCGGHWTAIAGEGGHADLSPVDDEELEIWQRLRRAHGRVSAETVLCGPGLLRLYGVIGKGERRKVEEIDDAAWRGEVTAATTLALFTRWLGRVAGNLALTAGARGGVYLAGGILPRWIGRFDKAAFRRAFEDKAPHDAWLREIPSYIVTHPQPGLLGLAVLASAPE
jgi:glucokinase